MSSTTGEEPRRAALWLGLLALLVSLPALLVGKLHDDWFHRLSVTGCLPDYQRDLWSHYDFMRGASENPELIRHGSLPWWTDPGIEARFFRPLSSALLEFDYWLAPDLNWPAKVHSLLWFALVAVLVRAIHRKLLSPRTAWCSTLIFALAGAHAGTLAWPAARHVLIGGAFALLTLWSQIRWSETGKGAWGALSGVALCLGLLGGEIALTIVPFVLGYEWLGRKAGTREHALRSTPVIATSTAYLLLYGVSGFGTRHMGSYVSPFSNPLGFLEAVVVRVPRLAAELLTILPSVTGYLSDTMAVLLWLVGVGGSALATWGLLRWAKRGDGFE